MESRELKVQVQCMERPGCYRVTLNGHVVGYVSKDSHGYFAGDLEYAHKDGCVYLCQIDCAGTLKEVRLQFEQFISGSFEDL